MVNIVVVEDTLVSNETLIDAIQQMNLEGGTPTIKKFSWNAGLTKDQFQEKILQIEKGGSEAVEIPDGILDAMKDADYLFVHLAPVSKAMLDAAQNLKLIGTCRGGLEHIYMPGVREKNIPLIHVIRNAEPVADFTLALMYTETRNIARAHLSIRQGQWRKSFSNDPYKTVLANQTVGLIGLGYIGKLVLKRLNALGINVIVYDPYVDQGKIANQGLKVEFYDDIKEVFKSANIISLHMRVTPETTNMINKDLIGLMRPDGYLINTARAAILNKDDLVDALQNKRIAGAALDVLWEEPIPEGDPLLTLDNITLTTHIAGDTVDAIPRAPYLLKDVINEYLKTGISDMLVK